MSDATVILVVIAALIATFVLLYVALREKAKSDRKKRAKRLAENRDKARPIIEQANENYGTKFIVGEGKDIEGKVFFDQENRKLFLVDFQGLNGIRDYEFFKNWDYVIDNAGYCIYSSVEIFTRDLKVPFIELNMLSSADAKATFSRIDSLMS